MSNELETPAWHYQLPADLTCKRMPSLGLAVIPPLMTISSSGSTISNSQVPTKAASKAANSAWANFIPMQLLGPCKKVKKA